jgi:alpha-1,2-mannosyltransferase
LLESEKALDSLQKLLIKFGLKERVKIITNAKRETLKQLLACSRVYLHSKKNEHFGISIVEAMSLGCIPVVHDSGGPKEFVPDTFRFKTIEEAADK